MYLSIYVFLPSDEPESKILCVCFFFFLNSFIDAQLFVFSLFWWMRESQLDSSASVSGECEFDNVCMYSFIDSFLRILIHSFVRVLKKNIKLLVFSPFWWMCESQPDFSSPVSGEAPY